MVTALRRARGFTLIELMTVLAVVAILAGLAGPAYQEMIARQRERNAAAEVMTALIRTRSEAIKRNVEIELTPTDTSAWEKGWSIAHPTLTGTNLDVRAAISGATISGPGKVTYLSNGRVKGAASPRFSIAAKGTTEAKCIVTDLSGRPYKLKTACP